MTPDPLSPARASALGNLLLALPPAEAAADAIDRGDTPHALRLVDAAARRLRGARQALKREGRA